MRTDPTTPRPARARGPSSSATCVVPVPQTRRLPFLLGGLGLAIWLLLPLAPLETWLIPTLGARLTAPLEARVLAALAHGLGQPPGPELSSSSSALFTALSEVLGVSLGWILRGVVGGGLLVGLLVLSLWTRRAWPYQHRRSIVIDRGTSSWFLDGQRHPLTDGPIHVHALRPAWISIGPVRLPGLLSAGQAQAFGAWLAEEMDTHVALHGGPEVWEHDSVLSLRGADDERELDLSHRAWPERGSQLGWLLALAGGALPVLTLPLILALSLPTLSLPVSPRLGLVLLPSWLSIAQIFACLLLLPLGAPQQGAARVQITPRRVEGWVRHGPRFARRQPLSIPTEQLLRCWISPDELGALALWIDTGTAPPVLLHGRREHLEQIHAWIVEARDVRRHVVPPHGGSDRAQAHA